MSKSVLLDSAGLACYIAWSFVFWNGSLLFGGAHQGAFVGNLFVWQGAMTALTALLLVLSVGKTAPLQKRKALLGVFAVLSSVAVVATALVGYQSAPFEYMIAGFALSGIGSTLRLGWEERLTMQGVSRTALCAGLAYLFGFILFAIVSLMPVLPALGVSAALPFGAFACLLVANKRRNEPSELPSGEADSRGTQGCRAVGMSVDSERNDISLKAGRAAGLKSLLPGIPWKLVVAIALAYFSYGATRIGGVMGGLAASDAGHVAVAGVPALGCLVAIALAFFFYRKNALIAFYIAFPLMALASLLPSGIDPLGGSTTFCVALVGAELVKYLVWFLMIDTIIKDGVSALLCLALMRFAQWLGSCLGQVAADALPTQEALTIAILVSLMAALLVIMGSPFSGKGFAGARTGGGSDLGFRVAEVSRSFGLSPREEEVLSIWATGHSGAYIEKKLFISKSTVKTHLNHIYAKTGTGNREELLELLDSFEK
ncbi:helix-turn-helix domain-containing protein [Raoultibacter phocaeensis]|uniref:helix-turn-helix domain-containing protein n=1 Tax=Raoultibacter phocaeensis TaxID=2479841 RepID=UPI00111AEB48|nr:helix-turn-helix transcriptional regulator [Raoultibacter phocaeensis]